MELFTVQRYDESSKKNDPEREEKILQRLKKKAEKRKRKFDEEATKNDVEEEEEGAANETSGPNEELQHEKKQKIADDNEAPTDFVSSAPADKSQDEPTFQVLGVDTFQKKQKVEMVLPPWLANPVIISNNLSEEPESKSCIDDVDYISKPLKTNLAAMKIGRLFPVQKEVIPWILTAHTKPAPFRPRDICVSAPTGSGKTLAFVLPIVQLLLERVERKIRALIVLPVNELAIQVFKVFKQMTENTKLSVCLSSKSVPFAVEQNQVIENFRGKYYSKFDIVVTTPGRLVEHLHSTKGFCLKSLKFLVIDEADRIMEQIYHNWLYHLDAHVKATSDMLLSGRSATLCFNELKDEAMNQPHKMLFSATLSQDPEKLQNLRLFQPKLFTSVIQKPEDLLQEFTQRSVANFVESKEIRGEFVGKYTTPAELTEKFCLTELRLKPLTLYCLIKENNWNKFLCFTNSNDGAHRLSFVLSKLFGRDKGIRELSSALKPNVRNNVLKMFAKGKICGLICSDALSRGIDIPDIDIVISYDAPRHIKTYIHRIGRTARAGRVGTAVTLLSPQEEKSFKGILLEAGKESIEEIKVNSSQEESFARDYSKALNELQKAMESENKMKIIRKREERFKAANTKPEEEMTAMDKLQSEAHNKISKFKKSTVFTSDKKKKKFKKKNVLKSQTGVK